MISYETIVEQLSKHVEQAKVLQGEAAIREELSAIRALCDVVLQKNVATSIQAVPKLSPTNTTVQQQAVSVQSTPLMQENRLQENDANGDSIFDF